ncbi:class I SAM-dependent methyltransferase [Treponema sp. OMZ 840]|uniref:class I SAM-dependent methyltransferase n=1 Tax=Treponema sp. OMZ 840 TaxID=244313 RepID=UPI003D907A37
MPYNDNWDEILDIYVKKITAPDGRDTFESTTTLVSDIINIAELKSSDMVIDIGSGWGNITIPVSQKVFHITGIEPNKKNIGEAEKKTQNLKIKNVRYIRGSFEKPNCNIRADKIISSLVFHQIIYGKRKNTLRKKIVFTAKATWKKISAL